jgi:hypothetical protein
MMQKADWFLARQRIQAGFPTFYQLPKRSRSLEEPTPQDPVLLVSEKKEDMMSSLSGGPPFLRVSRPPEKQSDEAFHFLLLLPTEEPRCNVGKEPRLASISMIVLVLVLVF